MLTSQKLVMSNHDKSSQNPTIVTQVAFQNVMIPTDNKMTLTCLRSKVLYAEYLPLEGQHFF